MQRTPPRRSPRLHQLQSIVASMNVEANPIDATAAASSAASFETIANPIDATAAASTAASFETTTPAIDATVTASTAASSKKSFPPMQPTSVAIAAAEHQQNILEVMQRQLNALESELRTTQMRLNERDLQCQSLKETLLNRALQSVSFPSPIVPPLSTAVTHCSAATTHNVYSSASIQPTVSVQPPVSFPLLPTTAVCSSYTSATNCVRSAAAPTHVRSQFSSPTLVSPLHIPTTAPIIAGSYNSASQHSFTAPRKLQDLPEFNGDPEDWPIFSTAYAESTAVYNYTNLENHLRLQRSLKGEARSVVRCMMIHAENVNLVMEQLRSSFGRPEQLVDSQLKQVQQISPISEASVEKLIPFAVKAKNLAVFLSSINGHHHLSNPTLLKELISKLPMSQKIEWARYAAHIQPYPTVVDFSNWLSRIADLISTIKDTGGRTIAEPKRRSVLHAAEAKCSDAFKCPICELRHSVSDCKRFLEYSVTDRWTQAKRFRLCFTCLEMGHSIRNCRRGRRCGVDGCKRSHHKLLHEFRCPTTESAPLPPTQQQPEANKRKEAVLSCTVRPVKNRKLLFRVLPVTMYGAKKSVDTYALLDEGSSITMMDSCLIEELGLDGHQHKLDLQWFGGRAAQEPVTEVTVHISGAHIKKKHVLRNVYAVSNLRLPMQSLDKCDLRGNTKCMKRLPVLPYSNVTPQVLIGLDHCHLGLPSKTLRLRDGGPYAAHTELGWVVFGPTKGAIPAKNSCLLVTNDALHELVADYFETESFGVRPAPVVETEADVRARAILESTTIRVDGRFQTGLLWKCDNLELPDSYSMAKKRLIAIERKLKHDNALAAAYNETIRNYVTKGYARKLQPAEAAMVGPRTWYLPHFAVMNPNKPGKLRLVFDAAATVNGISLNSCLLKGPQQYQPMPSVLFNFRVGIIAVCGDIREMFHQVLTSPEDRSSQRFLWRDGNEAVPPDVYEMLVMTFGAACSPCAAQYVKTINALEHSDLNARAVKSILQYHYVDDFVDSFGSIDEAISVSKQVRNIHALAGFELRGFSSNSIQVASALKDEAETTVVPVPDSCSSDETLNTEKVLGMVWQPLNDTFRYQLKFHRVDPEIISGKRCPTKRELLSITMSVFDPLGFLANLLIGAKLLMREVWRRELRWDELLPVNIFTAWTKWCEILSQVVDIQIPRHYFFQTLPKQLHLHIFADASEEAYAAVAYWRFKDFEGKVAVSFVCAKTKCAPLKPMTIPRLELQAAVLGTRLMQTIIEEHSLDVSRCVLWSDSKTVIKWIGSQHRRYKPFVAHRIAEILAATKVSNWKWIPTQENVADEATRSSYQVDMSSSSRWLTGPRFLRLEESSWPAEHVDAGREDENGEEELRQKFSLFAVSPKFIPFSNFSSYLKLKRTIGWVMRFVGRSRRRTEEANSLTVEELHAAEVVLCRQAQSEGYAEHMRDIRNGQCLTKGSALHNLLPYIDEEGVLRVSGRIDAASWLPHETKRPIILPPNHAFTELVVSHHHCKMKHQNVEATISEIRRIYWIPRLRQILRKMIAKCSVCKIIRVKPTAPVMGPLPEDRLTPFVRPFSYVGLDYFGPLLVTIGRRKEKRWVALFTCLVVRAIHLEVACDLSTDACILTIRNFINRRGVPVRIRSDNGKNFIGVDQEAKRFNEVFECGRIQDELSSKGVEWVFNCPSNPSEGGAWERMVQCVKKVLRHTLKEVAPREYTLQCLIIEAENVVNSRPLTHLPISVDQEEPLTPNHFILGSSNSAQTPSSKEPFKKLCSLRKQWRIARQMRDRFWKRWIAEYLPTLTRRAKWCQKSEPLKEGDLVFICDTNTTRKQWCRGRVERVYKGSDGVVRRADVRTKTGTLRRPVSKLAVLSTDVSESD